MGRGFESLRARFMVGIAQLVSAPDCGSGGPGFESLYPPSSLLLAKDFFLLTRQENIWTGFPAAWNFGPSPSGKAQDFDSCSRQFESGWPSLASSFVIIKVFPFGKRRWNHPPPFSMHRPVQGKYAAKVAHRSCGE